VDDSDKIRDITVQTQAAVTQSAYNTIEDLSNTIAAYEEAIGYFSDGASQLASVLDRQVNDRRRRRQLTISAGIVAVIAGVLALWGSSTISQGFFQTLLIALGGALVTFCLVDLILDKIVEIPSKEAKKNRELAGLYKDYVQKLAEIRPGLSEGGSEVRKGADAILTAMKNLGYSRTP
jgi:undecaprenyl pyrophosphate phosphatase UppP